MPKPNETERKIKAFSSIDIGWHFGEGVPPAKSTIEYALRLNLVLFLAGFSETDAFLGASGEIQVNGYEGHNYVELVINSDDSIEFIYEREDQQQIYQDELSISEAEDKILFRGRKWLISELFTKITTMPGKEDLQASPLARHLAMAAYLSLGLTAFTKVEEPIAHTFMNSTQSLPELRPSLSNSTRMTFQMVASS